MDFDFKPPNKRPVKNNTQSLKSALYYVFGLFVTVITLSVIFNGLAPSTEAHTVPPEPVPVAVNRTYIKDTIKSGDTLTGLLGSYLTPQNIYGLNKQCKKIFPLSRITTGQPYRITLVDKVFKSFEYDINPEKQLIITRDQNGFTVDKKLIEYDIEIEMVKGVISSSLFEAITEIGEQPELAMNLAGIFAWDIDFILDIRNGDQFQALVEKRSRDGKPAGYGQILAAEFTNQNETYRAFLFRDGERPESYYDENGENVRKLFLKAPLSFSRISSGFSMRRFHPVTKTWKSHPAIDYAASYGTPIKAVGDGKIIKISKDRYNGRHIKIRHNSTYQTMYLHMNKFARGMKKGKKVYQGEIIGYVGSSGQTTGPHLCFRMYKNGKPVNPTKVRTRSAEPVTTANKTAYLTAIKPFIDRFTQPQLVAAIKPQESR